MESSKGTHPLILVAAVAVTLASLAVAAHFTGLIPSAKTPEPVQVASAPPAAPALAASIPAPAAPVPPAANTVPPAEPQPAQPSPAKAETTLTIPAGSTVTISPEGSKPAPKRSSKPARKTQSTTTASNAVPALQAAPIAPPICHECGTVESVQEIENKGQGTGLGAVAGGVLGGVLGRQIGKGSGRDAATVVGAVGGAVGGHQIEKSIRTEKLYQVTVRFDDNTTRTFTLNEPTWKLGDRVRLSNGVLTLL